MATNASALLGLLNADDLSAFKQEVAAADPYSQMASIFASFKPVTAFKGPDNVIHSWTPGQSAGVSFAQSFLSNLFGDISRNNQSEQLHSVMNILPELYANPSAAKLPEGGNSSAFNALKDLAILKGQARSELNKAETQDWMRGLLEKAFGADLEVQTAGRKKKAEILGENDAWKETTGKAEEAAAKPADISRPLSMKDLEGVNPKSPQYADLKNQIDFVSSLGEQGRQALRTTPLASNFADIKTNFDALRQYAAGTGGANKLALISSFARILDPGSVVREGEIHNVENTQAFFSQLGANIENLLTNKQDLPAELKQAMLGAATEKYNQTGKSYQALVKHWQDLVSKNRGDPADVFGPVEYSPFELPVNAGPSIEIKTLKNGEQVKVQRMPDGSYHEVQ